MNCNCALCSSNKPFDLPDELLNAAINNDLVLFCGAGTSTEKKQVLPFSFYSGIREALNESADLSFPELMQKFVDQPNGRRKLLLKIKERFDYIESFPEISRIATAFHRELSEIHQIKTIITTNWDTYFENYCDAIPITIPEDFAFFTSDARHVIKIHGSINNLSSIIATTEDYNKCYSSLQNGVIGATLKSLLATKTVVFIGFSFGDDDFGRILSYLREEMGNIYPHIYIVTLDDSLPARLNYKNATSIITTGEFFLHTLKQALKEKDLIANCDLEPIISAALEKANEIHNKTAKIDLMKYPAAIFALAYQDGIIHAFERFIKMRKSGIYSQPNYIISSIRGYETIIKKCHNAQNYWDESYYEGYLNGLIFIAASERDDIHAIDCFPFAYLPGTKKDLTSFAIFQKELTRLTRSKNTYHKFADKIVQDRCGADITVHHPPY